MSKEVGWPFNKNAAGFITMSILSSAHVAWSLNYFAVAFAFGALGFAVDEILRVIKQQGKASDHQL